MDGEQHFDVPIGEGVQQPKIMISFMSHDRVHAQFAYDYGHLLAHTASRFTSTLANTIRNILASCAAGELRPEDARNHLAAFDLLFASFSGSYPMMHLQWCMTSLVPEGRFKLVQHAKKSGCSHILWLDTDMCFPRETLELLLRHNLDFVGANYVARRPPYRFTAATIHDPPREMTTSAEDTGLEEASHLPFGCLLTKVDLFEGDGPWFAFDWQRDAETNEWKQVGEDVFFCRELKRRGIKMWIDHELSNRIRHEGDFQFSPDIVAEASRVERLTMAAEPLLTPELAGGKP